MKHHFIACALVSNMLLSACATTTTTSKSSAELKDMILHANVTVLPIEKPTQLAERTKAHAIGNMIVSSVAGSVAASSGSAANPQQFQNNMEIGRTFSDELSKSLPTSYTVGSGKGADLALAKKLSEFFVKNGQSQGNGNRELSISVTAPLWELGYISLLTSQDYALNYSLQVQLIEKLDGKTNTLKTVSCSSSAKEKMPLDQWKSEDYAAVNVSAQVIVNTCFNKFLTETDLNSVI